jgi:hypothetical protein
MTRLSRTRDLLERIENAMEALSVHSGTFEDERVTPIMDRLERLSNKVRTELGYLELAEIKRLKE